MALIEKNQAIEAENKHKQLDRALMRQQGRRGALIEVLHEAQRIFGYLPRDIMGYIASSLHLPPSHVFGVASFYPSFRMHPPAEHTVTVCMGTACYVNGASRVLHSAEEQCSRRLSIAENGQVPFAVHAVHCLGSCGSGPVMQVDDELYLHADTETVETALAHCEEMMQGADALSDVASATDTAAENENAGSRDAAGKKPKERQSDDD